jgi:hypothetical protein
VILGKTARPRNEVSPRNSGIVFFTGLDPALLGLPALFFSRFLPRFFDFIPVNRAA